MLIAIVALSTGVLLSATLLYSRAAPLAGPPQCPNCHVMYVRLGSSAEDEAHRSHRAYEVFACPECTNTITRVHGAPSRFAYCPSCAQRTLETPTRRLSPTIDAPLAVAIEERCHVCGFHDERVLPESGTPFEMPSAKGQVIPFPLNH